jgi:hypothetical protein
MHTLRKEPPAKEKTDILRVYRKPLASSPITMTVIDPATLQFAERSSSGKQFTVTVRNGRISKQNLKPYGFVF